MRVFKMIVIGNSCTGKSALIHRYVENTFSPDFSSTVGINYQQKTIQHEQHGTILMHIWDTAGQERYNAIVTSYYRGALAALYVYDVCDRASFVAISQQWKDQVELQCILIGNKIDKTTERLVSTADGQFLANQFGWLYCETSALTSEGVAPAFEALIQALCLKYKAQRHSGSGDEIIISPRSPRSPREDTGCCN